MKKRAIFTVISNGTPYLDIWMSYYTKFFKPDDIYLICLRTPETLVKSLPCNKIEIDLDIHQLLAVNVCCNEVKRDLLKRYQWVVFSDLDEIIYHPDGLDNLLEELQVDYATCHGYEIIQKIDEEKQLDLEQPILQQRSYWRWWLLSHKPLLTRIDFNWGPGKHGLIDGFWQQWSPSSTHPKIRPNLIDNLKLLHLHKADYDIAYQLNLKNIRGQYRLPGKGELCEGLGAQNFLYGSQFFQWWKEAERQTAAIPDKLKKELFI